MTVSKSARISPWVLLLGAAFLSIGATLLTYIVFSVSMGLGLIAASVIVCSAFAFASSRMDSKLQQQVVKNIKIGIGIGILATIAYDLSRLLLVTTFQIKLWPFEAFPHFGYAIAGPQISRTVAIIIGTLYHVINGVFFSVSYCVLLGTKRWFYGILWALGLEVLMFSIYPTWLNLDAVMKEFTIVSVTGHLAYGAVLGSLAKSWVPKRIVAPK